MGVVRARKQIGATRELPPQRRIPRHSSVRARSSGFRFQGFSFGVTRFGVQAADPLTLIERPC